MRRVKKKQFSVEKHYSVCVKEIPILTKKTVVIVTKTKLERILFLQIPCNVSQQIIVIFALLVLAPLCCFALLVIFCFSFQRKSKTQAHWYGVSFGSSRGISFFSSAASFALGGHLVMIGDLEFQNVFK